jgi:hypothetical protein
MKLNLQKKAVTLVELMITGGISLLILGAAFGMLLFGRVSVFSNEATVKASEQARKALNKITNELRLSKPTLVLISNGLGTTPNTNDGDIVNFQIPVGIYNNELTLNADYTLQWGSDTASGQYVAYSVDVNSDLIRSTYAAADASDAISRVVVPGISSLQFTRTNFSSTVINIEIQAVGKSGSQETNADLTSSVRIRN